MAESLLMARPYRQTAAGITVVSVAYLVSSALAAPNRTVVCPKSEERANKWAVLALAGGSGFMTTLDASIVNISLPAIARSFGLPLNGAIEWVITAYLVAIAATLLTCGRLADMVGRKPIFLAGLALFTVASAACGAAPSLGLLIAARALQGIGAALIFAVNVAMIAQAFEARERGRALGINAVLVALGVSIGPAVGGVLTEQLSWRWIFYVNVPLGAVLALAGVKVLRERPYHSDERFDLAGAFLLAVAMATLTLGLSFGQEWGWHSPRVIAALAVSVLAVVVLVGVERRSRAPLLAPALVRNRVFVAGVISYVLCLLALFAVSFLLPFYLQELRGLDPQTAGLLLTPLSLAMAFVAPISGSLADRFGSRVIAPLGLAIACLGLLLLGRLAFASPVTHLAACLVVVGVGQGLFVAPNLRTIMTAVPHNEQGAASSIYATGRVIGQSLSVAISGAVFAGLSGAAAGSVLASPPRGLSPEQLSALRQTFLHGFHAALWVCATIAAVGIVATLLRAEPRALVPRAAANATT